MGIDHTQEQNVGQGHNLPQLSSTRQTIFVQSYLSRSIRRGYFLLNMICGEQIPPRPYTWRLPYTGGKGVHAVCPPYSNGMKYRPNHSKIKCQNIRKPKVCQQNITLSFYHIFIEFSGFIEGCLRQTAWHRTELIRNGEPGISTGDIPRASCLLCVLVTGCICAVKEVSSHGAQPKITTSVYVEETDYSEPVLQRNRRGLIGFSVHTPPAAQQTTEGWQQNPVWPKQQSTSVVRSCIL